MSFKTITVSELYELVKSGNPIDLVDVRTPGEFASGHAVGACSVPLGGVSKEAVLTGRRAPADQPTYIICQSGGRSRTACAKLVEEGLPNMVNIDGGTAAWKRAGLPVEPASSARKPAWIRPVGLLLVLGCFALGMTVNPMFSIGAVVVWLGLMVTGNAPCCSGSAACSTPRGQ